MKNRTFSFIAALTIPVLFLIAYRPERVDKFTLRAPAGENYAKINKDGVTILPNGRLLTPAGKQIRTAPHPFGMTISEDGKTLVTVNGGVGPFSLTVISEMEKEKPKSKQFPRGDLFLKLSPTYFIGAAIDSAKNTIYASGGNTGSIIVYPIGSPKIEKTINISSEQYPDSFITDIALSSDNKWLYALDLANFRLVILDTGSWKIVSSIGVGRNPFALVLTRDGKRAYVANMGTYQYAPVETRPGDDPRGISFPPFGVPSKEAKEGTVVEGRKIPGLGDPNAPEACSVWGIDVSDHAKPAVSVKIKTGLPVGKTIVGGSDPAGLAVSKNTLYVSNSTNDTVEAYDIVTHKKQWTTLLLTHDFLKPLRGVTPFGLALSHGGKRIYVAESGINAVGVLDASNGKILGHIPVGWYPARVLLSPDDKTLYVSNAKGFGAGPNGGKESLASDSNYVGRMMKGTVSIIPTPTDSELAAHTKKVLENNGLIPVKIQRAKNHPIPVIAGEPSQKIKYVVFITKENRTFDEVFGDVPGVNGDPELARLGEKVTVAEHHDVNVSPNHHALAKQFTVGDNFYVNSDVSADGHRWLAGIYANHWVETMTSAAYGGGADFKMGKVPGRLALAGSNSGVAPEDYIEHGSLWEHLAHNNIAFRNYGEGMELAGISEDEDTKPTGGKYSVNIPMPKVLFDNTSREYPTFNTRIPDQYRANQFLKEFNGNFASGEKPMPRFMYIYLPNDHGGGTDAKKGYPYFESFMADNDYALGRIVDALSHSLFWKEMAIFVTEDDAQSGVDHVDAHRSILLIISPWAKRGYITHTNSSITSIMKTMYLILGMPYNNLYDAVSNDFADAFTETPDETPYALLPVDKRIFDAEKIMTSKADYKNVKPEMDLDDIGEAMRQVKMAE